MKTVSYKTKNILIDEIIRQDLVKKVEKKSFFSKIFSSKEFADIYFHNGALDNDAIENIKNAKLIICNSNAAKKQIKEQLHISDEKLEVLYPAIDVLYDKPKVAKREFCLRHDLDNKKKIIFFTAKNFKSSGVKEFIDLMISLTFSDFYMVVAGSKAQITSLKFQVSKYNFEDKLLFLEDCENIDKVFLASDIFVLPTYNKNFASNVLKAMYCKCAVFTTINNASSELIDVFSKMETPNDRSMQFKLDALLQNKDDLKLIKKQNRKIAKKYTLDKSLNRFKEILDQLN